MVMLCYHDSLTSLPRIAPIRFVCLCACGTRIKKKKIKKKRKKRLFSSADLFRRYSQLPTKLKFGEINCYHTINISKTPKIMCRIVGHQNCGRRYTFLSSFRPTGRYKHSLSKGGKFLLTLEHRSTQNTSIFPGRPKPPNHDNRLLTVVICKR